MPSLADPLLLPNGQTLPNRLMKAAMSESLADKDNAPNGRHAKLYDEWAGGGYGLVLTGNVMVDRRHLGEPGNVVIEDERDMAALKRWAASGTRHGVPVWVQLNHPGRQANPLNLGHQPVAPSPVALNFPGASTPRELTGDEVREIITRFGIAAAVCEKAGFQGVQVHGAHGYLVSQFLSPLTNQRTDEWGGDQERRMRFALEVIRSIRSSVSPDFAVAIKLNSADFQRGGFSEDESRGVLKALAAEGLDLIEVSGGTYESFSVMGGVADSTRAREAFFLEYAQTLRSVVGNIPIAVTGGFRSYEGMSSAVVNNECDVVGLARPAATVTDAASAIFERRISRLDSRYMQYGMRGLLGKFADIKSLDGLLDLSWHTDQLHRVAIGKQPDPDRGRIATTVAMVRRNGRASLKPKRG